MEKGLIETRTPFYHFSVDDVFESFLEVSDSQIALFDHPFFQFLKDVHDEFNATISLYLFYQKEICGFLRTLAEVSDANKCVLGANPWLQLGPHALDYDTPPYAQNPAEQIEVFNATYAEIERFAGNDGMSKWVRLHYFSESYELAEYFRMKGVTALLSTDKEAISYRMPAAARKQLRDEGAVNYEGMTFVRTHFRVEMLVRDREPSPHEVQNTIESFLTRLGYAVVMTHEYELARPEVQATTAAIFRYFKEHDVYSL
jgi:hypothetical protein